jgi:hypothetical protein
MDVGRRCRTKTDTGDRNRACGGLDQTLDQGTHVFARTNLNAIWQARFE